MPPNSSGSPLCPRQAQQSLMPGHGDKIRPQGGKIHPQRSCRLGGVQNEGDAPLTAQRRHLSHRQNVAKYVGYMGKDRRVGPLQRPVKGFQGIVPVEQPPPGYPDVRPQRVERAGHGVVLEARYNDPAAGPHETADGDIQPVGAAGGEHHLFRAAGKQLRRRCPAVEHRPGRLHGGAVPAPARIGADPHGFFRRPVHRRGLVKRGGPIVKINHVETSSKSPSLLCR